MEAVLKERDRIQLILNLKLFLVIILLSVSCTISSIKSNDKKGRKSAESEKGPITNVNLEFRLVADRWLGNDKYWKEVFENGFLYGDRIVLDSMKSRVSLNNNSSCLVKVELIDDSDSFGNWRTWVTGLSLFIIPVKYNSSIKIEIINIKTDKKINTAYDIDTWMSLLLAPVALFSSDKEDIVSLMGNLTYLEMRRICN
jgi:hypothetical protein